MKAQEVSAHELLSGPRVFTVPIFQRRYSWRLEEWEVLFANAWSQYERHKTGEPTTDHFLGSIVLQPSTDARSTIPNLLVIDGQQRLTTLAIFIAAIRDARSASEPEFDSDEYDFNYLRNAFVKDSPYKIVPTEFDQRDYVRTVHFQDPTGWIGIAYEFFSQALTDKNATQPVEWAALFEALMTQMTFVEIRTTASDPVNTIFNTLNSKGVDLTPVDLIRNEFMWRLTTESNRDAYDDLWKPLERSFEPQEAATVAQRRGRRAERLTQYFWAQTVRVQSGITQRELFRPFVDILARQGWAERETYLSTLGHLVDESQLYLALIDARAGFPKHLALSAEEPVRILQAWDATPSLPLALEILSTAAQDACTEQELRDSLRYLESFLIRRALVGAPSNNLNRMLTPIPSALVHRRTTALPNSPRKGEFRDIADGIKRALSRAAGEWPSDEALFREGPRSPLRSRARTKQQTLILGRLAGVPVSLIGELRSIQVVQPRPEWAEVLGVDFAAVRELTSTIGNLVVVPTGTRIPTEPSARLAKIAELQAGRMDVDDSFPVDPQAWGSSFMVDRSRLLLGRAAVLWEGPGPADDYQGEVEGADINTTLRAVLMKVPDDGWTTSEDLSIALGEPTAMIEKSLNELGSTYVGLVLARDGSAPAWMESSLVAALSDRVPETPLSETYIDYNFLAAELRDEDLFPDDLSES